MGQWTSVNTTNARQSDQLEAFNRRHEVLTFVPVSQKSLRGEVLKNHAIGGTRCWLLPAGLQFRIRNGTLFFSKTRTNWQSVYYMSISTLNIYWMYWLQVLRIITALCIAPSRDRALGKVLGILHCPLCCHKASGLHHIARAYTDWPEDSGSHEAVSYTTI